MLTAAMTGPPRVPVRCRHGERSTDFNRGKTVDSNCRYYPKWELALRSGLFGVGARNEAAPAPILFAVSSGYVNHVDDVAGAYPGSRVQRYGPGSVTIA